MCRRTHSWPGGDIVYVGCYKHCSYMCPGPCYDFCGCSHCWRGWTKLSLLEKTKLRIKHIWKWQIVHKMLAFLGL
jgi:hypothetical protein